MLPLAIDLYCGRGGWTRGLLANGFRVIGFDVTRFRDYPGELVLQDCLTIDGRRLRSARVIVASPPCTEFSQVWSWAKHRTPLPELGVLHFDNCKRIAREAGVPIVIENVRGAQPHVGRAIAKAGSFYLWGDVPPLLPYGRFVKGIYNGKKGYRADVVRLPEDRAVVPFELARFIGACYGTN